MRAMIVRPGPAFSVADVCRGWTRAFRELGCETGDLNYDDILDTYCSFHIADRDTPDKFQLAFATDDAIHMASRQILAQAFRFWPDIVVIVSGFFVPPSVLDVLRARNMRVVLICTESPYETDRELEMAAHTDVTVLNDPTHLDRFADVTTARYVPHAYDPAYHHPGQGRDDWRGDLSFVGTGYPSRLEFFARVGPGWDLRLAGHWTQADGTVLAPYVMHPFDECWPNDQTAELYRSSKATVNLYRARTHATVEATSADYARGWAMGPREVEAVACGTLLVRERGRPEGDELLSMLPTFDCADEFAEVARWWLAHDRERDDVTVRARRAIDDRTFTNHARRLLADMGF